MLRSLSLSPRLLARRLARPTLVTAAAAMNDVTSQATEFAAAATRVAVVGIRPNLDERGRDLSTRPAAFVPAALAADGVTIIPIPTAPEAVTYYGSPPLASLADLATVPKVDVLVFFRKPSDLPSASEVVSALQANAAGEAPLPVAWLQSGIRAPAWEAELTAAGVPVVADRCMKVERARARARGAGGAAGRL